MKRLWLAATLTLLGAACATPPPRVPFQMGEGWHVLVVGGERSTNDRYMGTYEVAGVQLLMAAPGSEGWAWDASFRWGSSGANDGERITNPPDNDVNSAKTIVVDNDRDVDIYEISLGVRQTYRPEAIFQPYVGVGGSFFKTHNSDHYTGLDDLPRGGPFDTIDQTKHFQTCALGLYLSTGIVWNVLRDQLRDETEFMLDFNVRGLLGDEFSFIEFNLGVGYGR